MTDTTAALTRDEVEEAMRDVVDPELGINVVDLGLIYDVFIELETDPGAAPVVTLDMTLTSAACPLTDCTRYSPLYRVADNAGSRAPSPCTKRSFSRVWNVSPPLC